MTILDKVKENSKKHPSRIAISACYSDFTETMTWQELDVASDKIAAYLNSTSMTKVPVVVYGHKKPMMIALFLGCVKSGRAYCPIDVNVPLSRVEAIINEVNPEIIFSTESLEIKNQESRTLMI